jgi:hypothetical protein
MGRGKVAFTKVARRAFLERLGDSGNDLADEMEIPLHERRTFSSGDEARKIWDWLEIRKRLEELPEALTAIGRGDLANDLRDNEVTDAELLSGGGARQPPRSQLRLGVSVAIGVCLAVVASVGILIIHPWASATTPEATPTPGTTTASDPNTSSAAEGGGLSFEAMIVDTWDVNTNSFVGVQSYRDPTEAGRGTDAGHYAENNTVYVRCRQPKGREIKDAKWKNRPLSTTQWYRLTTPDPQWVPSMYVRLVPLAGRTVPPIPPVCT